MYCSHCGTENDKDDRFCIKCGKPLIKPELADDGAKKPGDVKTEPKNRTRPFIVAAILILFVVASVFGLYKIWQLLFDAWRGDTGATTPAVVSIPGKVHFQEIARIATFQNDLVLSPNEKYIAYSTNEKDIAIWDVATQQVSKILQGHSDSIISIRFSPDGKTLASSGYDWTVILWNLQDGSIIHILNMNDLCGITFLDGGKTLVTDCFETRSLIYWDTVSGEKVLDYFGQLTKSANIEFSPMENALLQYGFATTYVNLYDRDYVNEIGTLTFDSSSEVVQAKFLPDGKNVVAAFYDGKVGIWEINSKDPWWQKQYEEESRVDQIFVAPDKSNPYIILIMKDGTADLFDGISLNMRTISDSFYTTGAISPDNQILALGKNDTMVEVWALDGETPIQTLAGGQHAPPKKIIFSSTGDLLIVVPFEGETRIYQRN